MNRRFEPNDPSPGNPPRHLVLVGAGHAHVQVLRGFMMKPPPGTEVTVVVDRPEAVYSGMVPGFVCRDYPAAALEIDSVPLARRAGARVLLASATRIDPRGHLIEVEGRPPLPYDVASLDIGATVAGLDLPGVRTHALASRPIRGFVDALDARVERAVASAGERPIRVVVVGAGAAGLELAFTLGHRLDADGCRHELTVLADGDDLLPGGPPRLAKRGRRIAASRGIRILTNQRVTEVGAAAVRIDGPEGSTELPCDLAVWATGAAPHELHARSDLPCEARGFLRVRETLQLLGEDDVFAAGDCAVLDAAPWMPRAGVHAVREGPTLEHNLRAWLAGHPLRRHAPQRDFLRLLNLGDGRALGSKWNRAFEGRAMWKLKDAIDRRFMKRFQVLTAEGEDAEDFPTPERMGMEPMECGGCAAKVGASPLSRALARLPKAPADREWLAGLDPPEDAAVLDLPGDEVALVTVDAFRAFTDDPWLVGRVAAVNAVSDVLAKGGTPRHALALVTVPERNALGEEETLHQTLAGVRAALDPLGISLVGGHTTRGPELFVGLSVWGRAPSLETILPLAGARVGDALLLTRALGTGVVLAADMQGRAPGAWVEATYDAMVRSNAAAAGIAKRLGAHGATDVSGFGLAGHLGELLTASDCAAELSLSRLPLLPGVPALLERGLRSSFHGQNVENTAGAQLAPEVKDDPRAAVIFDPQTSGGLLLAVAPEAADATLEALHAEGDGAAARIGTVVPSRSDGMRVLLGP